MSKLPDIAISSGNMWPIYAALYLLFGTILLYIGTWIYFTFWLNKAGLPELKDILLGSLLALSRRLVDRNGNGISDEDEKQRERRPHNDFNGR